MSQQSEHEKRRRNKGLCGVGGCKKRTGDRYYCQKHAEARNEARRVRKRFLKEQAAYRLTWMS